MSDHEELKKNALHFHEWPKPGKLSVVASKPLQNQRDLALAYSPGVAAACEAIVEDASSAARYTVRGNLVGVVSNGTAVLGLGAIGPLASKPVMEGKAVLFKRFADIDVFDIEVDQTDPEKFIEVVAALEPTFGAINLEDIKAPDCFVIERELRKRMNIPVFHDDQHGTAIVVAAAVINALRVVGKEIGDVKLVSTGGGAAGIACLNQLVDLGLKRENVILSDHLGVCYRGRTEDMTEQKEAYAAQTDARTLAEAIKGADVFLGLSAPNILTPDMVKDMDARPVILALANPNPEIDPDLAREANPEAVIATGRSDFPNQVNNVLCFPFIFRGALDVGATEINEEMKKACVYAIADLTMAETSEVVAKAYGAEGLTFGPEYLIPKPFDPRLISVVAPAVAKAAMDSGVATRPITDMAAYRAQLERFVNRSGLIMKPIYDKVREAPQRVVFAEGEDERVLRAVKVLLDEKFAIPIVVGRPEVVARRIAILGLDLDPEVDFEIVNPQQDDRFKQYWTTYHMMMDRKGISPESAKTIVRTNSTVIAALMVHFGHADAMICGTYGEYHWHLGHVLDVIGLREEGIEPSALSLLLVEGGAFFICDTFVSANPCDEEMIDMVLRAAARVAEFGMEPKIALLSHANFGARSTDSAKKMQRVIDHLHKEYPELEVEGEMQADLALNATLRESVFPHSRLKGRANLLVMPTLDSANISLNLLKEVAGGLAVGPMLLGVDKPAHIATSSVTSRGLVDLAALAVMDVVRRTAEENEAATA